MANVSAGLGSLVDWGVMNNLNGIRIVLGVCGGIAAYKSPDLVRRLIERGAQVRVVMTDSARAFVNELTFQAVSGERVHSSLLDTEVEAAMGHIELARWADVILIAPATANTLARLRCGFADDLLSTLCVASEARLVVAPAMNGVMWSKPQTQENVDVLRQRGALVLGPGVGEQACGETGAGRMLEPVEIAEALANAVSTTAVEQPLAGRRVVLTAGPTREPIDPVRYISNHSSGKMGYAVANAARKAGAEVVLISGPVRLSAPEGVTVIPVESAKDMHAAVLAQVQDADIFVAVAAVADYRVATVADQKIKKSSESMTLALERNPDILSSVAALPDGPFTVGFAAETQAVEAYARGKLERKGLDMIAANDVSGDDGAFNSDDNQLLVLWQGDGRALLPRSSKDSQAEQLMALVAERFMAE